MCGDSDSICRIRGVCGEKMTTQQFVNFKGWNDV